MRRPPFTLLRFPLNRPGPLFFVADLSAKDIGPSQKDLKERAFNVHLRGVRKGD